MSGMPSADLCGRVRDAIQDYHRGWQPIDRELRAVCGRLADHRDRSQVYTKLVMVNRIYAAGLSRTFHHLGSDAEWYVATSLTRPNVADEIGQLVADLNETPLNETSAAHIVGTHGRLVQHLDTDKNATSFVSKYLHFHCGLVPIYDFRAVTQLRTELRRNGNRAQQGTLRTQLHHVSGADRAFAKFVADFMILRNVIEQAMPSDTPSVKELDHFLWHAWGQGQAQ